MELLLFVPDSFPSESLKLQVQCLMRGFLVLRIAFYSWFGEHLDRSVWALVWELRMWELSPQHMVYNKLA
jgi:hypothetical protein